MDGLYQLAEELSQKLRQQDSRADSIRTALSDLQAQVREFDGRITVFESNIQNNLSNIERIELELQDATDRSGTIRAQIEVLPKSTKKLQS